jgi:hypothetical protein
MLCTLFGIWCATANITNAPLPGVYSTIEPGPQSVSRCCTSLPHNGRCWREKGTMCHSDPLERINPD